MNPRILIVDDNPTNLKLASQVLAMEGYTVIAAEHAEQALALLDDCRPDLILMDIALPGMDGLELTRLLKSDARFSDIPIVALSAFAMKGDAQKALDAGCDGYITKPIDTRAFPAQVAGHLRSRPGPMRLLIVDDNDTNLRLLRAQLEIEGHTVLEAGNGIEALAVLEREAVDGVVSDILMPGMDGYRLCLEVRKIERHRSLPLVLYTATYDSAADRELARASGADAYIAKPAPTHVILEALRVGASSAGARVTAQVSADIESPVLKQYSETLVRKLEKKSLELARAYEGLVQVEARLSGLLESALDAIIAIDDTQRVILFNAAATRMFGRSQSDALGRPLHDFIPQGFRDILDSLQQASPPGAVPEEGSGARLGSAVRSDGSEFPIEASISGLDTSQGRIITLFIRDITRRRDAERALARSEAGLQQAQRLARLGHVITAPDGTLVHWSDSIPEVIGVDASQMPRTTRAWLDMLHPEDRERLRAHSIDAARTGVRTELEYRMRRGADWVYLRQVIEPLHEDNSGTGARHWFNTLQDITDQKRAELKIRKLNRVHAVLSGINTLIVRAGDREELFREACRIAVEAGNFPKAWIGVIDESESRVRFAGGYGGSEAFFMRMQSWLIEDASAGLGAVSRAVRTMEPVVSNDIEHDPKILRGAESVQEGSRSIAVLPLLIEGKVLGVFVLHAELPGFFDAEEMTLLRELAGDIAFALDHRAKADQIHYLASFDALTGLPNRSRFVELLAQVVETSGGATTMLAVVVIDLVRFRRVNETLGRAAGDEMLRRVAARLKQIHPTAARIGLDQFAVKFPACTSAADVARTVEETSTHCFGEPFLIGNEELRIGCRNGVALFPGDGTDAETLLRNAEAALRRAKAAAELCVFYSPAMNSRAAQALAMESSMRRAIKAQEFVLHYQPKVGFADGRICGVEALIRWQSAERGLVPPGQFISILEESGLIGEVGEWALHQALADARRWAEAGHAPLRVAVNVSPSQLRRPDFAAEIGRIVGVAGGAQLELEITESLIMDDVSRNVDVLREVREHGVSIAIDDFGTGYCSLAYIAMLPVTSLKIDRSFVVGMSKGPEGMAIVSSIIALAHALKLKVVAEGVETEEQADLLRRLGCDEAQGYLYCRPIPFAGIEALLRADAPLPARDNART